MAEKQAESTALNVVKYTAWTVYAILTFACIVLAFGFALLLAGADPDVGFADFIYNSASRFMDPFRGLVEPTELSNGRFVAWSALFAIAAYVVVMWVVSLVAGWARRKLWLAKKEQRPSAGGQS